MSSFTEKITAFAESVAYPNRETHLGHLEHDASHGSNLVDHEPATGIWDRLHGENTARQIRSQGDCGAVGMEDGLQRKAIRQQEQVAERSRLAREGLFEPHMKHEELTNLTEEHRDVASGSKVFGGPDVQAQIAETLKDGGIGRQVLENQKMN